MDTNLDYEEYEDLFYPHNNRPQRDRPRGKKQQKKKSRHEIVSQLSDFQDDLEMFVPSYAAVLDERHHERRFVIESVEPFYRDGLITDLTRLVKGGKEANVYVCTADPRTGRELFAAKVYRPRMLRHLKNDAVYKAGRTLRDDTGKLMKGRRVKLALLKKTDFGKHVDIQWWIGNEYRTQSMLHEAGADVPQPIAHQGNTILMEYIGEAHSPAPTLSEISLPRDEAQPLFERVMHNVALMLDHHHIHGDLSAYNILYWEGRIVIIDFPQMVEARHNPHAFELLGRDIERVCQYFARFGVEADPQQRTLDLWQPYMGRDY